MSKFPDVALGVIEEPAHASSAIATKAEAAVQRSATRANR
jgi:hypothetical protein